MKIKRPLFFVCALPIAALLLYFVVDRTLLVATGQRATGTVEDIVGNNDLCRGFSKYTCTKFTATLRYAVNGVDRQLHFEAGSARGHDQPTSQADYVEGQTQTVIYDRDEPQHAYRNALWDLWSAPILTLVCLIAAVVASFTEKKRRN